MNLCAWRARRSRGGVSCSPQRLAAFRDKLSRALLDRFDLVVTVPRPRALELATQNGEGSGPVRARVVAARSRAPAPRTPEADELLSRAVDRLPLSARGRARVARVARTIAALAGADAVAGEHVAEALAYRSPRSSIGERRGSRDRSARTAAASERDSTRRRGFTFAAARTTGARGPAVAVVGARACSAYGAQVARRLGRDLPRPDWS
jgi:Mg-chelatase subunit ChlI